MVPTRLGLQLPGRKRLDINLFSGYIYICMISIEPKKLGGIDCRLKCRAKSYCDWISELKLLLIHSPVRCHVTLVFTVF